MEIKKEGNIQPTNDSTSPTQRFGMDDIRWWVTQRAPKRMRTSPKYKSPERGITRWYTKERVHEETLRTYTLTPAEVHEMIASGHKGKTDANRTSHYMPVIHKGRLLK